ncbi:MAG: valine--tRNA ligase [Elusimicrobia bacterium]|nr:valine--tRNA ligase [Elusimicrobiota bacterium]
MNFVSLSKTYDPKPVEEKWLKSWAEANLFSSHPKDSHDSENPPFVMVIPPPNITGALHMGHALNNTLQDIMVRFWKMQGKEVNWVPGTDHGGIATQNVVEKVLKAEGKKRTDLGREAFLERMWVWKKECGNTILEQLRRMGCALDLRPENMRFTMDEMRGRAVAEAFKRLWEKGLIYRGERMINWCVRCGTALSDIEVEYEERDSKLWHIHYPLEDGKEGSVVATTRPESMLGDTAVAVHPEDKRWKHLIGKKCRLPLTQRIIPIVGDKAIDLKFGTGALKVTPAHDPVDFEIGQRHKLDLVRVIGLDGKMTSEAGESYAGLDRDACRKKVVEDLKAGGFLKDEKPYHHSVGVCYRCNQVIEPLLSEQWFLKMAGLAQKAIQASKSKKVIFYPESWERPYLNWLENIRDWCISRQIWWGHRLPVWYCVKQATVCQPMVSFDRPAQCVSCGNGELEQDPDVLDTWFSSGLWPFSVFGWPEKTKDLNYYYPTTVLITGYEILYLWVARMVMMGLEFMEKVPFKDVYIHGIVRDKHGKKMSKSLGNVVDPLVLMDKYGTDAMRFALAVQTVPGRDIQFAEESLVGARNFTNKIYNATRYILMSLDQASPEVIQKISHYVSHPQELTKAKLDLADRWILGQISQTAKSVKESMVNYRVDEAARIIYEFLWGDFCDWYVEISKLSSSGKKAEVLGIACVVLERCLGHLHPIMPFISEELEQALSEKLGLRPGYLLKKEFSDFQFALTAEDADRIRFLKNLITGIRTLRSEYNIPPGKQIEVQYAKLESRSAVILKENESLIAHLAKIQGSIAADKLPSKSLYYPLSEVTICIPQSEVDVNKLKSRLDKERSVIQQELENLSRQLEDKNFLSRAPEEKVDEIRQRHTQVKQRQSRIEEVLKNL